MKWCKACVLFIVLALLTGFPIRTSAANMTPIPVTGFNMDLIIESNAAGPPFNAFAQEFNPGEGRAFYQQGLAGKSYGMPASGAFASATGDGTTFQFQPYTSNNALVLSSANGLTSGTLMLASPGIYQRIAIIANSASGGSSPSVVLNFSDGSTFTTTYNAPDWFNNSGYALLGTERISLSDGSTQGAPDNPRFYQTTIDLNAALGLSNKPLVSLTFFKAAANSTAIYAISGEVAAQVPPSFVLQPTNTTVTEATSATFTGGVVGNPFPSLQWYKNGSPIVGATNSTLLLSSALYSDNSSLFRLVATSLITNVTYSVTSSVAMLTVVQDSVPPVLVRASSYGLTQIKVSFSEKISAATVTNLANYGFTGPGGNPIITGGLLDPSQSNVFLNVTPMTDGAQYTLTINNLKDQSSAGNVIAPNSQASFIASPYVPLSIGNPALGDTQVVLTNGMNIISGGASIGGASDQFHFGYVPISGDFDFQVRLDSLSLADAWSEAGLMAREDLTQGGRHASVLATPSISGAFFQYRSSTNAPSSAVGSAPVNYPNTWLRLKRSGNAFTGFASYDGKSWLQLGTLITTFPSTVYFGFVVSSHNIGQTTVAAFRDFGAVTSTNVSFLPAIEGLGQSSRRTSLVISEIMYHPTNSSLEFIELFNTRGEPQDMSGYQLGGSINYTFPSGTSIPGGGFLVVAKSPATLQSAYGLTNSVLGPYTSSLPKDNGTVQLINQAGGIFLEVNYDSKSPWPISPDGTGHSLALARPSYGENNPEAWAASDSIGGSPGRLDSLSADPLQNVVINEFLAHTDDPDVDYIELYNHGNQQLDISGCVLTDDPDTNKFVIPSGTLIAPHGFVYYTQTNMNFALNAEGETIYFKNAARTRIIDAVRFDAQENGISMGRYPDGGEQFYRLNSKTPGALNSAIKVSQIVINELMYNPISLDDDDQYVELYNRGGSAVNIGGWTLADGISYTFPSNTVIAPDSYLVVARNSAQLLTKYPNLNANNTLGNFGGKLSHNGERVALTIPDTITNTNGAIIQTDLIHIVVDEVTYGTGGRWGQWADGGGSSLELTDPHSNHRLPSNWADSDETAKAPWTIISATGTIDNGSTMADQLQVLLQGAGECLIDNVQVLTPSGSNLVANSTFESGPIGWIAEGTESTSSLENAEGYNSSKSYHVRAVDRGDNQVNRIRTPIIGSLSAGTTNVTIRAAVRWLKGHPEVLLRLRGNWLECAGEMILPISPGTPGARNSRFITNAPPAIVNVKHSPVLPAANQSIVVSANVQDPDGLSAVFLKYRIDPNTAYTTIAMNDNGTGGDLVAGDGIYSASIPGQVAGTVIAFYIQATDNATSKMTGTFPANVSPSQHECLVRVGEVQPTGNFPVYRIWMTQGTLNTWTSRNKLDNTPLDVTFVLNDNRVIYNTQAGYAGSPYIAPGYCGPACGRCGYSITMPGDDLFLGEQDLVLDWPGGHGGETSALQEQMGYWIADKLNLPFSHRYTIRMHVNGVTDDARQTTFEAVMQPAGGFLKEWLPNLNDGELFKIDRAFEFNDSGGLIADTEPRLQNYTTTGGAKKRESYRWNWNFRSAERVNDYTDIFSLVDAVNAAAPEPYTSATLGSVDVEEWMRIFATEHIIVNFDAYGHQIGKNMYAFLPERGKWQLYMFDLDWLMLAAANANGSYAASAAPLFNADDPTIIRMYNHPPFARAYWRAVQDAVNGPLVASNCNPVMDAKYQSLVANNIKWCDGQALTDPGTVKVWFSQRRAFLQSQLAAVNASGFAVNAAVSISNNMATITGTAPVNVKTIWFNGAEYPVTWTSVTGWTVKVPLKSGTNSFNIVGVDVRGQPIAGYTGSVNVIYNGSAISPVGRIVINEVMYNPAIANAQYVELYNNSTNIAFDLSGWQFKGLSYTFPAGALIGPNSFLVLAADRTAFAAAYGATKVVFDTFSGTLQNNGETLTLIQPGTNSASDVEVAKLRYDGDSPWPVIPGGSGSSLQLIDPLQDNWRAGNWTAAQTNAASQWVYFSTTGTASSSTLYMFLQSAGDVYVDDVKLVAGSIPEVGSNLISNGDFESAFPGTVWNISANMSGSTISTVIKHFGVASLHMVASSGGTTQSSSIWQTLNPALSNGAPYTLSFWYLQSTNGGPLTLRLSGSGIMANVNPAPNSVSNAFVSTPSATNSTIAPLPAFPSLWINEVQAENLTGITNSAGQRTGWVEIYNPGSNVVSLSGLYLANNYTNLTTWGFPPGAVISPGQFKVIFADGLNNLSTLNELHANFTLPSGAGKVALSRLYNNQFQVIDYLTYKNLGPNHSYGSFPDGQSFNRQDFYYATGGGTNNGSSAPLTVVINEWMAGNTHTIQDPLDGNKYDDWFELYNYGTNAADLTGYYLTSSLTNQFMFQIPSGYAILPNGFLLVWADKKSTAGSTDLHVNFKLSKSGTSIGLYGPDGTPVDYVTFGEQTSDISMGRYPDGSGGIIYMTTGTPRAKNIAPNTVPVLGVISNRVVTLGQTLKFDAIAVDSDQPPQILSFTLGTGAPAGASINPASGQFVWTPVSGPSTNAVSVVVTDNGVPSLSATQTFIITVVMPPRLEGITINGNELILNWLTAAGQNYQVEYKDDLNDGFWTALGGTINGTGERMALTNKLPNAGQRFYRLRILP
jgi:Lamin Tail Domain/CotH kinase protein